MNKELKLNGHGKIVCKICKEIITQCRCMEGHKHITYIICDKCKSKEDLCGKI